MKVKQKCHDPCKDFIHLELAGRSVAYDVLNEKITKLAIHSCKPKNFCISSKPKSYFVQPKRGKQKLNQLIL